MSNIGERIRTIRERRNMSQLELAEAVGYKTASAINKIEMGLRDLSQSKIKLFAEALNIEPSELMGWDSQNNISEEQLKVALFGGADEVTPEMWEEVKNFAEFVKSKYNKP
ncbi:MAG: helix-turn-helix transcriptional regulator [Prevotellaceae bacterium]|nr:helix-turn-helix transcriptional regulator [Candidatus Faecinaster equi]